MKVIRCAPATGKPPKIICTGCGKRATEAGSAYPDDAAERFEGSDGLSGIMIDTEDLQPLCETCVTAMLDGEKPQPERNWNHDKRN